jgi:hypothetical protein
MALREVLARFGIDFDSKAVEKADASVEGLVGKLKSLLPIAAGTALVTGLVALTRSVVDQADSLRDSAIALGLSVEELQAWRHAAGLSGVAAEQFDGALTKFNRNVAEAAKGTGAAAEAFKELGVSVKDTQGNIGQPIELLDGVAEGLKNIEDPARRTALVMDLFGRSGAKLLPLLSEGPEGMRKLRNEIKELGGGFTKEFADGADEMNDNLLRLDAATLSLKIRLANFLLPVITRLSMGATRLVSGLNKWADGASEVIKNSNIIRSALLFLGGVGVAQVFRLIGGWKGLVRIFSRAALILGRFLLRLALPILLIDELITTFQGGDTLIRRAIDSMFGEGTTQQIVDWFKNIIPDAQKWIGDGIQKFKDWGVGIEDVKVALTILAFTIGSVWVALKVMHGWTIAMTLAQGGLNIAVAAYRGIVAGVAAAQLLFNSGASLGVIAVNALAAAFVPLLTTLAAVAAAYAAVTQAMKLFDEAGGAGGIWSGVKSLVTEGDFFSGIDDYQNQQAREAANNRAGASVYPTSAEVPAANMSGGASVEQNITVNVPPGTPETLASRTANATAKAVRNENNAAYEALVQTSR